MKNEHNDIHLSAEEKLQIQKDCTEAPLSPTQGLRDRGKSQEDLWFRVHETELMEEARKRNK